MTGKNNVQCLFGGFAWFPHRTVYYFLTSKFKIFPSHVLLLFENLEGGNIAQLWPVVSAGKMCEFVSLGGMKSKMPRKHV